MLSAQTAAVNSAVNYSELGSGMDDLARLRGYFDTATLPYDSPTIVNETKWRMDQLRANSFRSITDANGTYLNGTTFVSSTPLTEKLDLYKDKGLSLPHIVVGSHQPSHLSGSAWLWTPAQWDQYEEYCYKFIKHVMTDYRGGWNEVRFEITNEMEVAETYWSVNGSWSPGHLNRYNGFLKIYREWAQAAQRFANETGKQPRVMGPVTGVGSFLYWTDCPWYQWFIRDVVAEGLRFDAFTLHFYGPSDTVGSQPDYYGDRIAFSTMITAIRNELISKGRSGTPIYVTEWGACDWFSRQNLMDAVNPTPVGGAWTAAFLREMLTTRIDDAVMLYFREPNENGWNEIAPLGSFGKVTYPKPSFNVLRMFAALPGTRKQVATSNWHGDLGVIASASADQIGVLVHNFNFDANNVLDKTEARSVTLTVSGAPFSGQQTVRRYLVDANNSNVDQYLLAGQKPPLSKCELKLAETFTVTFSGGSAILPARTLGKSAVSLFLIGGSGIPGGQFTGDYTLRNVSSGKLMDVASAAITDGANVIQLSDTVSASQVWQLIDAGNGYYVLKNVHSGKAAEITGASQSQGAQVKQYGQDGADEQLFSIIPFDDGNSYKIIASHSGLSVSNGGPSYDGRVLGQDAFWGGGHQVWSVVSESAIDLEAESATLGGGAMVFNATSASGGMNVGGLHAAGAYVQFSNVSNPNPGGKTKLEIIYSSNEQNPAVVTVYRNGTVVPNGSLVCAGTGGWGTFSGRVSVALTLGSSDTIKVVGGQRGINIDYVRFSPTK
ncbi:MAG: glycosyl hydrolase 39 family protein [Rariglobus sp.]|nr:glycosyl hydrolase 39 family protein [Rariglobus sp.]